MGEREQESLSTWDEWDSGYRSHLVFVPVLVQRPWSADSLDDAKAQAERKARELGGNHE